MMNDYQYVPILSISPAEMNAFENLPEKDKDLILPLIPLKGWVGSHKLEKSIIRLNKSIGDRDWIADLDPSFLEENDKFNFTGEYPREVFHEIKDLLDPSNGYENWVTYIKNHTFMIPTLQLQDLSQLESQLIELYSLNRGIVVKFTADFINYNRHFDVLAILKDLEVEEKVLVIFDYGKITKKDGYEAHMIRTIRQSSSILNAATFSISGASFPSGFAEQSSGANEIFERKHFNKVKASCSNIDVIYSDRGGARAEKLSGGGGIPSPRIDYPCKDEWYFIRKSLDNGTSKEERNELYREIATEIMIKDYWEKELRLWGVQLIEFTSQANYEKGITNPLKATAARLNIHMHKQLHYGITEEVIDTDEDWED